MTDTNQDAQHADSSLFAELRRLSPKVTGGIMRARQATYEEGHVPAKFKLLTAVAISVSIRCDPCIRAYVNMAIDHGVMQEELVEFLNVAMTMQGCPGEEWALKAFGMYKEVLAGHNQETSDACCSSHSP